MVGIRGRVENTHTYTYIYIYIYIHISIYKDKEIERLRWIDKVSCTRAQIHFLVAISNILRNILKTVEVSDDCSNSYNNKKKKRNKQEKHQKVQFKLNVTSAFEERNCIIT